MLAEEFLALMESAQKRHHVIGNMDSGIIAALDMEGRLFAVLDGRVINRVNPEAIAGHSTREGYLNPGGDGLWPAPEGTCLGYEYATGKWRVPPSLTNASYLLTVQKPGRAVIEAEVDLVNNQGRGIPTIFRRDIRLAGERPGLLVRVTESIRYIGAEKLGSDDLLLTPWTLCQFDCGAGCEVVFPDVHESAIRDLYEPSDRQRLAEGGLWHVKTDATQTFQVGMDQRVPWIEFRSPASGLSVKRRAASIPGGQKYIDIADAPVSQKPDPRGVRYSVYCDTERFMEIEAAGGCPDFLEPETELSLEVETEYIPGTEYAW